MRKGQLRPLITILANEAFDHDARTSRKTEVINRNENASEFRNTKDVEKQSPNQNEKREKRININREGGLLAASTVAAGW